MVEVYIPSGVNEVEATKLTQWDYGQSLRITGENLPSVCQVHFCNQLCPTAEVRIASEVDGGIEVSIPDRLLEQEHTIHAFIYLVSEGKANTIKKINIPVTPRTKPDNYVTPLEPSVQTQIDELIANVNAATNTNKEIVEEIKELYKETVTVHDLEEMVNEVTKEAIDNEIERIENSRILLAQDVYVETGSTSSVTLDVNTGGTYEVIVNHGHGGWDSIFKIRTGQTTKKIINIDIENDNPLFVYVNASVSGNTLLVSFGYLICVEGTYRSVNSSGDINKVYRIVE